MIEITKKYRTRDGRKWETFCVDFVADRPVVGRVTEHDGTQMIDFRHADGRAFKHGCDSADDLIEISPYEDWPIDAPVWVKLRSHSKWVPRHFAMVDSDSGRPTTWLDGYTSHTAPKQKRTAAAWHEARLASEFTPTAEERGA